MTLAFRSMKEWGEEGREKGTEEERGGDPEATRATSRGVSEQLKGIALQSHLETAWPGRA